MSRRATPLEERLLANRKIDEVTGCWRWTGAKWWDGYGQIKYKYVTSRVHRLAYELWKGPIFNIVLHIQECPYKDCFNPDHLKDGTYQENMEDRNANGYISPLALRTHCKYGHQFTEENTYDSKDGVRRCKQCRKDKYEREFWYREKKK